MSAVACAITIAVTPAFADETGKDRNKDKAIDTVTIIGKQSDVADIAGSAHVIDEEALSIFNETDILRVLRAVPGVYVQEEEGFGLRPNIGIRGSGLDRSSRIALLEDGVLIAPAPYASPSAYYFPTQRRMSGLEVLKGPASVAVGPRTTGGAINMISTPIPDSKDLAGSADVRFGDYSTLDAHVNVGKTGDRFSWMVETVQAQSDGFKNIQGPVGGDTGYDIEDYVAKFQLDSDPSARVYQSLRLKLGYTDQTSDETYLGLTAEDFAADPLQRYAASANDVFESEHEQVQLSYAFDFDAGWRGTVTAYRNDFSRNWYKLQSVDGSGLSGVLADPNNNAAALSYLKGATSPDDALQVRANNREYYSQGLQATFSRDFALGRADVTLNTGFRLHEDEEDRFQHQDGYRMQDGQLVLTTAALPGSQTNRVSDADATSLFVDASIRAGDWILTPGVRFEDVTLRRFDYSTADPSRSDGPTRVRDNSISEVIPGIGALYRVNDNWRLLAGIHKGYNPPGPGSTADAESSLNIEAGTRFDDGALSFEAIAFVNDYDNLVGTVTESTGGGGDIGDQFDGGEVVVSGLELSAAYGFAVGRLQVPVGLHYTYTNEAEFRNAFESGFEPWGDVQVGDELPYIPEHQWQLSGGLAAEHWRVDLAASYVDDMRSIAGQGAIPADNLIESHVVWNFVANIDFTEQLSTYVKVDNLFDETYASSIRPAGFRPGLPRTAYVGLKFRL